MCGNVRMTVSLEHLFVCLCALVHDRLCVCVCERERASVCESMPPHTPYSFTHLAGVQPILQRVRAPEARDDQVIEGVFTCQGQQGSAHPHTQQHKQA